MGYIF